MGFYTIWFHCPYLCFYRAPCPSTCFCFQTINIPFQLYIEVSWSGSYCLPSTHPSSSHPSIPSSIYPPPHPPIPFHPTQLYTPLVKITVPEGHSFMKPLVGRISTGGRRACLVPWGHLAFSLGSLSHGLALSLLPESGCRILVVSHWFPVLSLLRPWSVKL